MKLKGIQIVLNISFHAIFWLWNLIFLTVVYFGILPIVGIPLIQATLDGDVTLDFFITLVTLIAIPTVCTGIGLWYLRKQPRELMRLFYGVEAPLFVLCLVRFFVIRELTPASTLILGTLLVCIFAFGVEVVRGYRADRKTLAWLQASAHALMFSIALQVGIVLLFYAVPFAATTIAYFFSFAWIRELNYGLVYGGPLAFLYLLLFGFSSTLFLGMPSAFATLYLHSGQRILRAFAKQYGSRRAIQTGVSVVGVWMILFFSFNVQPQVQAFNLLDRPLQANVDRQALLSKSETIRQGLVNAYLSPYRYLSTTKENNHIYALYKGVFQLPDYLCLFLQKSYNQLMSPFLYQGSREDRNKAQQLYAEFFDTPLQKVERKDVQHALQSTSIVDEAKAGLMNIDEKRVWLQQQAVTVKPHGDWADVEIYEVYENQTPQEEEIFYYFSLPESATITGLWLGDTNDLKKRFPFVVSPRGAAQEVYNSQVQRVRPMDPALLEQVGPRSYRLRAFPIARSLASWEKRNGTTRATQMHLWLTYKVLRQEQGWALPQLAEKRNIFWTNRTQRIRNGKVQNGIGDAWLEAYLSADKQPLEVHQVNFKEGYRISAIPLDKQAVSLLEGKKVAIILDSSRSMAVRRQEVKETFAWLQRHGFADNKLANNDADLYLSDAVGNKPQRLDEFGGFDPNKIVFYGSIQPQEILKQFEQLRGNTSYDAILLVTDEGSYELSDSKQKMPEITAPLWLVHLGDKMPPAYEDAILSTIQNTRGGVSSDIEGAIERIATQETGGAKVANAVDSYTWQIEPGSFKKTSETGFEPLAARQLALALSQKSNSKESKSLAKLDAIHAIAKTYKVVTPYSSMIVLVNEEQRQMLKQAEARSDRFNREVETGQENLDSPSSPFEVSGVPEPEEWMLMVVGAIAIMLIIKRRANEVKYPN